MEKEFTRPCPGFPVLMTSRHSQETKELETQTHPRLNLLKIRQLIFGLSTVWNKSRLIKTFVADIGG